MKTSAVEFGKLLGALGMITAVAIGVGVLLVRADQDTDRRVQAAIAPFTVDQVGPYIRDGHLQHIQDQQTGYCYAYARPGDISSIAIVTWIPCDQAEKETP